MLKQGLHLIMTLCGPNLSSFGLCLSVWGIIQLGITGVLFHTRSVALIHDVLLNKEYQTSNQLINDINIKYDASALNCWIAALMYVATLCISAQQFWSQQNKREIKSHM